MHDCPLCDGGIIRAAFKPIQMECFLCNGMGQLTNLQYKNYNIGRDLRAKRIKLGLTLRDFAAKHNLNVCEVSDMELGIKQAPDNLY